MVELFDKHDAAKYCETTEANIFYHHYISGALKGGKVKYGRLMWNKQQLDAFKQANPQPGFKERPGVQSVTVSTYFKSPEYLGLARSGDMRFTHGGHEVKEVKQDDQNTRLYSVTVYNAGDEKDYTYEVWNNTRFVMEPLTHSVPPAPVHSE